MERYFAELAAVVVLWNCLTCAI